ncbi:hypothetical protein R3P38DRAFT_3221261 [Favolaschia claudopus]|uniref:F-box domain-containing protein n=1 Tax=Favolaschia claudopus TaxID=2862362 RepID=A0AAV9ZBQ6_9AGAR
MDALPSPRISTTSNVGMDPPQWKMQIQNLLGDTSDDEKWMTIYTMTARQLFFVALECPVLFGMIRQFLEFVRLYDIEIESDKSMSDIEEDSSSEDMASESGSASDDVGGNNNESTEVSWYVQAAENKTGFSDLPPEIGLRVLQTIDYAGRCCFAKTSKYSAALVAEALRNSAVTLLAGFALVLEEIRLMQTATGAAITGLAVVVLARPEYVFPEMSRLEIVAPVSEGASVVDFLRLAAPYELTANREEDMSLVNVTQVWTLQLGYRSILVFESATHNPLDVILQSPLSCLHGAWTANGLWLAYPAITTTGSFTSTSQRFDVSSPLPTHRKMWELMRTFTRLGDVFYLQGLTFPHVCGVDPSCPATLRVSHDGSCLTSPFPKWTYTAAAHRVHSTCWTMGGTGCARGSLLHGSALRRRLSTDTIGALELVDLPPQH